ncbi:chaperone modulator CbpM [Rhodoferax sp.]|uniref:chaperone modulator CbpM n=1 Tax=Rhodoferax sp. TaxID=50421 RepID=UPI0027522DEA|nr:chaperone modulator CbpM [Rhodoferax sp.]
MSKSERTPSGGSSTGAPLIELTLIEIGRACAVETTFVVELVHEGIIAPHAGRDPEDWRFPATQLRYVSVAARLQRELGVNLAGAALVLQLLDEVETLRAQIAANPADTGDDRT